MSGKPADAAFLSPAFVRVTVANFCFFLTFASFFLLPLHVRALGGTESTVGSVMGTNGVAGLVGIFVLGPLLDRIDRRLFLRGGLALMATAALAFLLVVRIGPFLYLLRVLQGIAFAAGYNAASTLAVELAPPARRSAALGAFGVSTLATHALAPTIGEQLVHAGGFRLLFVVAACYSAIGLALTAGLPAPGPHHATGRLPLALDRTRRATVLVVALMGVAFGTVITFTPTFVHDAALGSVSTFFLSYTAAAIGTRFGAAGLGDRLGHRRVAVPALALLGGAIGALALVRSAPALAAVGLVFGTAQGVVYPTLNAFAIEGAAPGQFGRLQTLFNGAFNLGVTSGSFALGQVADRFGHRAVFATAGAIAGVALAVLVTATPRPRAARDARRAALDSGGSASG